MLIIYENELHKDEFDRERFLKSLKAYGEINDDLAIQTIQEKIEAFPLRHVSVLVREAVPLFKKEEDARAYYEAHTQNGVEGFERLRRITGRAQ